MLNRENEKLLSRIERLEKIFVQEDVEMAKPSPDLSSIDRSPDKKFIRDLKGKRPMRVMP